jgi:hypothetical protein
MGYINYKSLEKHRALGMYVLDMLNDGIWKVSVTRVMKRIGLYAADRYEDRVGVTGWLIKKFYPRSLEINNGHIELRQDSRRSNLREEIGAISDWKKSNGNSH